MRYRGLEAILAGWRREMVFLAFAWLQASQLKTTGPLILTL